MEKRFVITLFIIFVVGYLLRVIFLPQNALTFGYDQARDAVQSLAIAHGDLKIQGPSASTPGLYHGVFYYYVLAPIYLLSAGNPIIAAYWIAFLNCLTILLIAIITLKISKNKIAALIASFVFAISFESTQYAVWLSNPTIAIWTLPLYYLGLWLWLKEKNKWGAILAGLGLGLSIQAEIFLLYHIVPGVLLMFLSKKQLSRFNFSKFVIALVAATFTMILTEVKFGFRGVGGFLSLASGSEPIGFAGKSFGDYLLLYANQLGRVAAYTIYPRNIWIAGLIFVVFLFFAVRSWKNRELSWQPFLLVWIFSHITVVSLGGVSTPFLLVGIAPAICILMGIGIAKLWRNAKYVAVGLLIFMSLGNISMIREENPKGQTIFGIQKDMLLSKQLQGIDYTYEKAAGSEFSINSLTSPLWINIVWSYLYDWYGKNTYGYTPYWHGRDQIGQVISLPTAAKDLETRFLIIEPMAGIPARYLGDTVGFEDVTSHVVESQNFGEIVVEYRNLHSEQ